MTQNPVQNAVRQKRREERLGPDAACALCGVPTPEALLCVDRSLLEEHHVVGRANDRDLTIPVCRNCHAVLTEGQLAEGVPLTRQRSLLERLRAILLALAAFLTHLADRLRKWAEHVAALIADLDRRYPSWRKLKGAA